MKLTKISLMLLLVLSGTSHASKIDIDCYDGMTFGAGRIVVSEKNGDFDLLLRNYASHGRKVEDLARDLKVEIGEEARLTWVRVKARKENCQLRDSSPILLFCNDNVKVTFLSGWSLDQLEVVGSASGRVTFSIDEANIKSLHGFPTEGAFSIGTLTVTNDDTYEATAQSKILSQYCRPS